MVVGGVCLLAVLVAWTALIGPDRVLTGPGPVPSTDSTSTTSTTPTASEPEGDPLEDLRRSARDVEPPFWVRIILWVLEVALLSGIILVAVVLLRRARDRWALRVRSVPHPKEREFEVLARPDHVQEVIRADAAAQDRALSEGEPRNAIVEAWHRFELHGARAGVERHAWETSSEFALRILNLADADPAAVNRLAELYREARFSDHPIDESHRAAAVSALAQVRSSLPGVAR